MNKEAYIDQKILEFEEKLTAIRTLRALENQKKISDRNYKGLYLLHKDEVLYLFCIEQFKLLKEMP
ncbi:hypothetical protein ACFFGT_19405 [Mucilaginibacter angelicae]|uniref:Uncharacterized protein n=1 Tax=Mucilaginibacter angelicae TaxID=869718 RepID=A0ABV6LAD2_9SPHI